MTDLFSWAEGGRLRDTGMELASAAQEGDDPGWGDRAYQAIVTVASSQALVHVDDILRIFRDQPKHYNAWGSVWQRVIKDGVLVRTSTSRETADRRKHRHRYPIYQSLICLTNARVK